MTGPGTSATATTGEREVRRGTRSGLVGLVGAAVNGLLGFALTVLIVRGLGPAGSGAVFTAIGVVTVLGGLCCAGADTALVWALPRRTTGRDGDAARLLPVALLPALSFTVAVAAAGVVLAGPLAPVFFDPGTSGGADLFRLAFAGLPFVVALAVLLAAVRGVRPVTALVAVQYVLLPAARPALVLVALAAGAGVTGVFAGWLAPALVAGLVCVVLLVRPLGLAAGATLRPTGRDWRMLWGFALPRAASAAVDAGSMWLAVLLTAALADQVEAGVIGAVGRYALAGLLVMQGLRVAVAPQLSRLLGQGHAVEAAMVYRRVTSVVIALSWPGYLLLAIFAPGFLLLFGADFTAGASALVVLAGAMMVNSGTGIVQTMLLMSGSSGRHLFAAATGLVLNVGLAPVLIPPYGALGAALCWAAGITVENVVAAVAARRVVGEPLVTRGVLRVALVSASATAAVAGTVAAAAGRGVAGLALTLGVAALLAVAPLPHPRVRRRLRAALVGWTPR
ncbi:polysaccharide biosynthesis C-terminal domain-containing protein [Micromonospora eburnea]|uniref:Membrane protein involved in the export of O-antigen and teichoic acid n=1 Tax=Micromonospora eburnea TaxID=227316 RepID=A0A1C6U6C9_9ACTN|nr:polysaccharide biosynthesis C-terminal domain-containing protein [Micromonospora eburnea]SCL49577.1 Membrane protein involved in the export of O-antigen and teichoic acid [Micromonospora eburnea]